MEPTDQCFICKNSIRAKQQKLQCTGCYVSIHRTCTKMSQSKYREYIKENQVSRMKCDICETSGQIEIKGFIDTRQNLVSTGENSLHTGSVTAQSDIDRVGFSIDTALSTSERTLNVTSQVQSTLSTSAGTLSPVVVQSPVLNSTVVHNLVSPSNSGQSSILSSSPIQNIPISTVSVSTSSISTGPLTTISTTTISPSSSTLSSSGLSGESTSNDTGEQNPFLLKMEDILIASLTCNKDYAHEVFDFSLKSDVLKQLKENSRNKKTDIAVKLRFWIVNDKGEIMHGLPSDVYIRVNWQSPKVLVKANGEISKAAKKDSIDITDLLDLHKNENKLRISMMKQQTLHFACEIFRMKSINELLEGISVSAVQRTRDFIMSKFKTDDVCEVTTTNIKASLTCPIGKMRLKNPCRSKHCNHIQCVDAETILAMNKNKPVWKCPICQQPAAFQDLYIDGLMKEILKTVLWNVVEVEFLEDGTWTHKGASSVTNDSDKENICVMLDETIDKLDVIDLTETDEENTPIKKPPLKTNTSLMNKFPAVKNLIEEVANKLDKVRNSDKDSSSSLVRISDRETLSSGCHRNKRTHSHQTRPYDRSRYNYNKNHHYNNSVRNNRVNTDRYKQVSLDRYSWSNPWRNNTSKGWRNYNSSNVDSYRWSNKDTRYSQPNDNTNSFLSIVFRPFNV